jgi:hypothetical protein
MSLHFQNQKTNFPKTQVNGGISPPCQIFMPGVNFPTVWNPVDTQVQGFFHLIQRMKAIKVTCPRSQVRRSEWRISNPQCSNHEPDTLTTRPRYLSDFSMEEKTWLHGVYRYMATWSNLSDFSMEENTWLHGAYRYMATWSSTIDCNSGPAEGWCMIMLWRMSVRFTLALRHTQMVKMHST